MRFLRQIVAWGMVFGFACAFYSLLIAPLRLRHGDTCLKQGELRRQIANGQRKLNSTRKAQQSADETRVSLNRLIGGLTEHAAMVELPERIRQHFARFGLPVTTLRLNSSQSEPDLQGYQRVYWSAGIPLPNSDRNLTGLLLAVAEFEKQEGFVKVVDFALHPDEEDPSRRGASINIMALVRE